MKRLSLRNRILLYFIIVPLGAFIAAAVLTITDMFELQDFASKTGVDVANEAIRESAYAMQKEVHSEIRMLADGQAAICQLQMRRALAGMGDMALLYKDIHAGVYGTDGKGLIAGENYSRTMRDDFTYINYPAGLSKDDVEKGLRKITMMRNAFKFSCAYNDYYAGMGIALPNGLFFKYDWFPVPLDYEVSKTEWFKKAIEAEGTVVWFDPGLSNSSNKVLLTFSQAVVIDGKVEAVIVIDVFPQTISDKFVITRGTGSFAFLVAPSGKVVACEDMVTKKLRWDLSPREKQEFANNIMSRITLGKRGSFVTMFDNERLDVAFTPMSPGYWGVGVATPIKSIRAASGRAVSAIKEKKEAYLLTVRKYIEERILIYLGLGCLIAAITLLGASMLAISLGKPIKQLKAAVEQLARKKLNKRIELKSHDEFQELGDTFNAMAVELNKQIKNLKENIAHQERARHELLVAAEIQRTMLPDASLAFPKHDEFDIYAEMHPAKEVGGDFYDFFFVDEKKLFFAIGDISGKGLSAALFMMRALTLLRHEAEDGFMPDQIFINVGNELEHNNDSCMFFTGTCGIMNIQTGEVAVSNAGHPPPYLRRGNSFDVIDSDNGLIVGALPLKREQFNTTELRLEKGDTLFFYTDGVTEAFNCEGEEFHYTRLRSVLEKIPGANPREIIDRVTESIEDFRGDAPQADDITMLTIKYYG